MLVRNIKLGTIATTIAFTGLLTFGTATTYAQGGPGVNSPEQRPAAAQPAAEDGRGHGNSWLTSEEKQALVADVLGMSVEELTAAKEAGQSMEEIVEAQGMTVEEFQAAKQTAMIAAVNQAVADGELTQEEADAIIERIENGGSGNGHRGHGHRGGSSWLTSEEKQTLIAGVLGMSVEELAAAKEAGQSMDEIVEAQGLTEEEFDAAKDAAMIAAVNQAVADGELTQEEADAIIERIENGGKGDGHRGHGHSGKSNWLTSEEKEALKADVLGMSVEELAAAKEAGQSLSEIAEAQGMTLEEFRTDLNAALIVVVNQAVADGELTQEQADRIIQRIERDRDDDTDEGDDISETDTDGEVQALSILSFASSVTEVSNTTQSVQVFMPIVMR